METIKEGWMKVIIFVSSVMLYVNSTFCGFVFDDLPAVVNNKDLQDNSSWSNLMWNDFWGTPMRLEKSHKSYRPLTVFTFRINRMIFGSSPWSYHAVNALLHALASVLYLTSCLIICQQCSRHTAYKRANHSSLSSKTQQEKNSSRELLTSFYQKQYNMWKNVAYIASLLFAVHPVHCEAVTGVVGRAEILSAIFVLLCLIYYTKFTTVSFVLSAIFCVCAVLSKEQGVTVLAVCIIYDFFIAHKLSPMELLLFRKSSNIYTGLRSAVLSLIGCGILWSRYSVMKGILPSFTEFDNPAAASTAPAQQLTYNYILALNTKLLLSPGQLLCDWTMGTVPLITNITDQRNVLSLIFWVVLLRIAFLVASQNTPHAKLTMMGLALLVFPFLPASNLFFPVGFVLAERILYIPSMGFCLLVALGISKLNTFKFFQSQKPLLHYALLTLLVSHSLKTIFRNRQWESDFTLFSSGLQVTRRNAKVWNNVGHSLEMDSPEMALLYFKKAAAVQPDDIGSHMNVARTNTRLKRFEEAEEVYVYTKKLLHQKIRQMRNTSARIDPGHLQLFVQLGNLLKDNETRLQEVDALYKEAISLKDNFVDAYINRGEVLIKMNHLEEAIECYKIALTHASNKDDIYFNLGVVYTQMGNLSGAIEQYTYAIQHNTNHVKALYNSAVILEETRDPDLLRRALIRVEKILSLEPDNYLAHSLLGSIHLDKGEVEEAVKSWTHVLKVEPNDTSALFNMALMYSKMGDKVNECFKYLEQLLEHHPDHVKGLMLYGDLLLNKRKDKKGSANAFARIIESDPTHIQARHNYCVVMLQEGRLVDAERCMNEVFILAPDQKYVADNLAIIKQQLARQKKEKEIEPLRFKVTDEPVPEFAIRNKQQPNDNEEDFVYVEPLPKKKKATKSRNTLSYTAQANEIKEKAKKAAELASSNEGTSEDKLKRLEDALKHVHNSVRDLRELNGKLDVEKNEKCPTEVATTQGKSTTHSDAKKKALDLLDELEKSLL